MPATCHRYSKWIHTVMFVKVDRFNLYVCTFSSLRIYSFSGARGWLQLICRLLPAQSSHLSRGLPLLLLPSSRYLLSFSGGDLPFSPHAPSTVAGSPPSGPYLLSQFVHPSPVHSLRPCYSLHPVVIAYL